MNLRKLATGEKWDWKIHLSKRRNIVDNGIFLNTCHGNYEYYVKNKSDVALQRIERSIWGQKIIQT